ncbi:hypothetical protein ABBQ38_015433 [Trebouxia sp. C0009 RCD-2024]
MRVRLCSGRSSSRDRAYLLQAATSQQVPLPSTSSAAQTQQPQQEGGINGSAGTAFQGGYVGLVADLQSSTASRQQQAANDVWASSQLNRDATVAAGVVPLLVAMSSSNLPAAQEAAAAALLSLADGSQANNDAAGAVPLLVALLRQQQAL